MGYASRVDPTKGREPGVCLPWEAYEGVKNLLRHKAHHGLDLLGRAALIPDVTLAANRRARLRPGLPVDTTQMTPVRGAKLLRNWKLPQPSCGRPAYMPCPSCQCLANP